MVLQVLNISQFRAVLAHEFGHYYQGDTQAWSLGLHRTKRNGAYFGEPWRPVGILIRRVADRPSPSGPGSCPGGSRTGTGGCSCASPNWFLGSRSIGPTSWRARLPGPQAMADGLQMLRGECPGAYAVLVYRSGAEYRSWISAAHLRRIWTLSAGAACGRLAPRNVSCERAEGSSHRAPAIRILLCAMRARRHPLAGSAGAGSELLDKATPLLNGTSMALKCRSSAWWPRKSMPRS